MKLRNVFFNCMKETYRGRQEKPRVMDPLYEQNPYTDAEAWPQGDQPQGLVRVDTQGVPLLNEYGPLKDRKCKGL